MSDVLTVIGEACGQAPFSIIGLNVGTCTASACTPIAGFTTERKCVPDYKKAISTLMGASPYYMINFYTNSTTCTGTSSGSAVAVDGKCRKTATGAIEVYSKLLWDGKVLSGGAYSDAACATPFVASASGSTPIPIPEHINKCISAGVGSAKISLMDKGAEVVVAGAIGTGTAGTATNGRSGISLKTGAGSATTSLMDKGAEVVVAAATGTGSAGMATKGSSGASLKAGLFVVSLVFGALLLI